MQLAATPNDQPLRLTAEQGNDDPNVPVQCSTHKSMERLRQEQDSAGKAKPQQNTAERGWWWGGVDMVQGTPHTPQTGPPPRLGPGDASTATGDGQGRAGLRADLHRSDRPHMGEGHTRGTVPVHDLTGLRTCYPSTWGSNASKPRAVHLHATPRHAISANPKYPDPQLLGCILRHPVQHAVPPRPPTLDACQRRLRHCVFFLFGVCFLCVHPLLLLCVLIRSTSCFPGLAHSRFSRSPVVSLTRSLPPCLSGSVVSPCVIHIGVLTLGSTSL
jgi:hypothetical protein